MTAPVLRMPRWFDRGVRVAGAVEEILGRRGVSGWVADLDDLNRRLAISVMCAGRAIARGRTGDPCPEIGESLGVPVLCGFEIAWSQFDEIAVRQIFQGSPAEPVEICVDAVKLPLPTSGRRRLTIADCHDRILGRSPDLVAVGRIEAAGLFDMKFYLENGKLLGSSIIPGALIDHYFSEGEPLGLKPNPLFDPKWYARTYLPQGTSASALQHYVTLGERLGYKPCPLFDPRWYREQYLEDDDILALSHFLQHRRLNEYNPNPYFDVRYYLSKYPDVANADLDGFGHWLEWGMSEGRSGSPKFNAGHVWSRYLGGQRSLNPFEVFLDVGLALGWDPAPASSSTVHRAAAESVEAGALFERLAPFVATEMDPLKVVAMYLPQFHTIPENDLWWGEGFTEWRNLARALPRYVGHIQPRTPRDLGFYELAGSRTLRRQVDLARHAGLHGFCYYYYNFNGRRLLEKPIETFLQEEDIDFPFCLLWANENWTRRWDGMDQDILIAQDYREGDAPALVADIARHMQDRRYMRSHSGRPYFFVYRADIIPNCAEMLDVWRRLFRRDHGLEPLFFMCQTFRVEDPRPFGFDGALEFPPHKLTNELPTLNAHVELLDPEYSGPIYDYKAVVDESLRTLVCDYPLIKTAFPNWDNSARRQSRALSIAHSTPHAFEGWTAALIANARTNRVFGDALVFVNAWNEWAEGAYLEPDTHFGFAYLNALRRAIGGSAGAMSRVVLVGHDAFPAGAQHLLLALGKLFQRQFGLEVYFVLLDGGALTSAYREIADTFVASEAGGDPWAALRARLTELFGRGFRYALCNSVASGGVAIILDELKYDFCSLAHELPTIVRSRDLGEVYAHQRTRGRAVVYPNAFVKHELDAAFGVAEIEALVIPQGLYASIDVPEGARLALRQRLGLPSASNIVLSVGYGDLRKGVDIFLSLAERCAASLPNVHFVWLGDIHPDLSPWLKLDIERRGLRNLFLIPFDRDVGKYLGAADIFLSTAREDPFPSAVLESLAAGVPVVAFQDAGGHAELLAGDARLGSLTPYGDLAEAARTIAAAIAARAAEPEEEAAYRRKVVATRFGFARYGAQLLRRIEPGYRTVSVIVPNYNYGAYLQDRLSSIFKQTYPVLELVVLDDASQDDSLRIVEEILAQSQRVATIKSRATNSGNVFRQWKDGLDNVQGEFVWIAEADDTCAPRFLAESMRRLIAAPQAVFCFCDSRAVGPDGAEVFESYKAYYSESGDHGLDEATTFSGDEFLRRFLSTRNVVVNASAVVWRAQALRDVFNRLGENAFALRCAGDWRIYVEACRLGGEILYISRTLNTHRRHDRSVTLSLDKAVHLEEIAAAQQAALAGRAPDDPLRREAEEWRRKVARSWNVDLLEA